MQPASSMQKVKCSLVGVDSNAFALLAHWKMCARRQGWSDESIRKVISEATSGDYNHLLATLAQHCENNGF